MKKIMVGGLIILLVAFVIYCNLNSQKNHNISTLMPIKTIKLSVPEPSGLYYDKTSNTLWTVSDENSLIYNIDMEGNVINTISVNGLDLEGITIIQDSLLLTILERDRIIVFLDKQGNEVNRINLQLRGEPNKGLEGISFNSNSSHIYLVNEKDPSALLEIDISGEAISEEKLSFAPDLSGLSYNLQTDELWIISDEDEAIFRCSTDGSVKKKYKVKIEQIEGIAIDSENELLFLISDPLGMLYIFDLP